MVILEAARIRLNGWQQAAVAVGSAVGAIMNPGRGDLVAAMGETTGRLAFERVLQRMKNNPEGRAILKGRPRIVSSEISHVWELPPTSFGGAYATFMRSRNFSPDDRVPVRFFEEEEDELSYVVMRSREAHDVWHTLFGLNTNLTGELALKVIEFQQMKLPMALISFAGGSVRFNKDELNSFYSHHFPWAFKAGLQCTDLMSVYYEKYFDEDLEDVRRKWGILPAPRTKRN